MRIQKSLPMLLLILLFGCFMGGTALAHEVPDTSRTGSISVKMEYDGKAVAGGTMTIYQAGKVKEDNGNYSFTPSKDFADCGENLENIEAHGLAERLAKYASNNSLTGTSQTIEKDGTVVFDGLETGLYLVVQTKATDGYEAISPFMVSVPQNEGGTYIYDVDAAPKLEGLQKSESTPPKVKPPKTTTPEKLPQTGQLNWPVPVMAALGLCLFFAGWVMRFGKRGNTYES